MTGTAMSVVPTFPFGSLAVVTGAPLCLVDVGSGRGHTANDILTACPKLKDAAVVLQDLTRVIQNGQGLEVDPGRVKVQPYDFLLGRAASA